MPAELKMYKKNGRISVEAKGIAIEDLAEMTGFLQMFLGAKAFHKGLTLDDVKDKMLDIHLASMELLEYQLRNKGFNTE